jgi:hypothetical protein
MRRFLFVVSASAFVSLGFFGAAFAQISSMALTVKLDAQNGSGESGTAMITPQGNKTEVVVKLTGGPKGTAQPAHIHAGSCDKLDPQPKIPLQNVMDGTSTTMLDMPLKRVMSGGAAINVLKSTEDLKTYVACGDLKAK